MSFYVSGIGIPACPSLENNLLNSPSRLLGVLKGGAIPVFFDFMVQLAA